MRILAASLLAFSAASAQNPTIVSTEWLAQRLGDPRIVVLHATRDTVDYPSGHIPGARHIRYDEIRVERDGIGTELPPPDQLQQTFERLGVSDSSHVVIYSGNSGMAPVASRVFLSLDFIGHPRVSLLSGGLATWRAERRPVTTAEPAVAPGRLTVRARDVTVDARFVTAKTGARGVAFIDTRTTPEYVGAGSRSGLPSEGHIAGARQLEWEQLFADSRSGTFLETDQLRKLFAERMSPGDTVITYCMVGYRASMTYFVARSLGLPVFIYDGSYQDWARRQLPLAKGATP